MRARCYGCSVEPAERANLVESHLDLSRKAAAMIFLGLADAASKFDPARGASFSTYAYYRVQGAIVDGLRKQSNLPRRVWANLIALRAASEYLENRAERDAGAAQTGAKPAEGTDALAAIKSAMSAIRTMYVTSLEGMRDAGFDAADTAPLADEGLDTGRLSARLRNAIAALPERERALMTKHYWEGKNLLEAGAELGISKSWASRLHAQAVERLRTIVDADTG
jgi:RNA polymerase sigma factor FliA